MKVVIGAAFYIAVFLTCAGLRVLNLSAVEEIRQFPDTGSYTEKATWPLWSWGRRTGPLGGIAIWWLQGRPPTVPFFYKLAGNVPHVISIFQLSFAILCWGLLALFVSIALEFYWLKPFAFLIILLFSLSDPIIMWDGVMLSESISLTLMALLIASWLWLLENWNWQRTALMLMVVFLWAFSRDTNAWVILMLATLLFMIGSLLRSWRCLSIVPVLVMFFVAAEVSRNYSQRWVTPFFNVIGQRILPNAESTASFAQLGMPVTPALMRLSGQFAWSQDWAFYKDPALQEFRDWAYHRGKSTYIRFLLAHPIMTIQEPLRNIETLIAPTLNGYRPNGFSPILIEPLRKVIYLEKSALLWVSTFGIITWFAVVMGVQKREPRWLIPILLIMLAYPHAALVWYGDPAEVGRHALQAGAHFRVGLWMFLLFAADMILTHWRPATAPTCHGRIVSVENE